MSRPTSEVVTFKRVWNGWAVDHFPEYMDVTPDNLSQMKKEGIATVEGDTITIAVANGNAVYRIVEKPNPNWWIAKRIDG